MGSVPRSHRQFLGRKSVGQLAPTNTEQLYKETPHACKLKMMQDERGGGCGKQLPICNVHESIAPI